MNAVTSALAIFTDATFWITAIAIATPLLLAAIGAVICGQTGILSLNIEGVLTAGALTSLLMANVGHHHWTALAAAAAVGAMIGLFSGVLLSPLQLPPRISGLAVSLFVVAMCQCIYGLLFPARAAAPAIVPFASIDLSFITRLPLISWLSNIHFLRDIARAVFHAASPTYLTLVLLPAVGYLIYHTPLGMALRACGRNPDALAAQGRSVSGLRIGACIAGAAFAAIGGATLALTGSSSFSFAAVSGRGFAALTLALIAGWRLGRTLFAVLAFAMIDAFQSHLQHVLGATHALVLSPLLPYAVTIIVLVSTSRATARRLPMAAD
jgi:general nucleoside transport system permease protein